MTHSKLPFKLKTAPSNGQYILDADNNIICFLQKDGNQQFIVKACNNHYKLVDVLKRNIFGSGDNLCRAYQDAKALLQSLGEDLQQSEGEK